MQVAMARPRERRGAARASLIDEAGDRVAPDAARVLVDVNARVVLGIFEIFLHLCAPSGERCFQPLAILLVVRLQAVASRVLEALQVPLEPAVVLVKHALAKICAGLMLCTHCRVQHARPVALRREQERLAGDKSAAVDAQRIPFACCSPRRLCIRCATNASRSAARSSLTGSWFSWLTSSKPRAASCASIPATRSLSTHTSWARAITTPNARSSAGSGKKVCSGIIVCSSRYRS